ncbi:U box domain [Trypanosoma vivax]|uniref:U-box domain-containing protein n=1 Tax=Trypanosoma vivax (strain Y486) TaxID=1055687 RepID=G0TT28_TRYVY|nr:hypothetical protein TRVL_02488 [Trypanosoma vivax]KAH8619758.1 U box domain [Trypanosoma vivax]CCC47109.1 conserved hypothetical protein [Trypanosoma vivax Y486]
MSAVKQLFDRLSSGPFLSTQEMIDWAERSDTVDPQPFFGDNLDEARHCVRFIADTLITKYMNNPNTTEVPLDHKTRACLIVSNFALYKPVRDSIFDLLAKLEAVFEESIKADAALPFNPELGRMTEHVAVLLIRVTSYKLKAANILEFTDGNVQFSVQLMLAVLLKEPAYEPALRCNCINIILGFTQPQAYFSSTSGVEDASCEDFTEKINSILKLMLRLNAVQVLDDVLSDQLDEAKQMNPVLHLATCSSMRCILNIFRFSSVNSTQWRQHILLSTTLLDHSVALYLQIQSIHLERGLAYPKPDVDLETLHGMSLGFKFASLSTFGMGSHTQETRLFFPYLHDLLHLPVGRTLHNPTSLKAVMRVYVDMFHLMANIDALGGDDGLPTDDLFPQLQSEELKKSVASFLREEVAPHGLAVVQAWFNGLRTVESDTLVERGTPTFAELEKIFSQVESEVAANRPPAPAPPPVYVPAAAPEPEKPLLADIPPIRTKRKKKKIPIEKAAEPILPAQRVKAIERDSTIGADPMLLCALTGNVMKKPVISPHGHTFDEEAILSWLQQNGSICPITGRPLEASELRPDKNVVKLIMRQVIAQTMSSRNQENEADLYDF